MTSIKPFCDFSMFTVSLEYIEGSGWIAFVVGKDKDGERAGTIPHAEGRNPEITLARMGEQISDYMIEINRRA